MPAEPPPTQGMPTSPEGAGGWRLGDRYLVTGRIGAGGMAEVFRAHDEMLARDVAVKVFRAASTAADTTAGLERQRAELLALAQLNHPHLITLYDGSVGRRRGERLPRHGAGRGPEPRRPHRAGAATARGGGPRDRRPGGLGAGLCPRRGHGPPGRQAGQHPARRRVRAGRGGARPAVGLRHRPAAGHRGDDRGRLDARHRELPRTGAGSGLVRRPARRRLRLGADPARGVDGVPVVRGRLADRGGHAAARPRSADTGGPAVALAGSADRDDLPQSRRPAERRAGGGDATSRRHRNDAVPDAFGRRRGCSGGCGRCSGGCCRGCGGCGRCGGHRRDERHPGGCGGQLASHAAGASGPAGGRAAATGAPRRRRPRRARLDARGPGAGPGAARGRRHRADRHQRRLRLRRRRPDHVPQRGADRAADQRREDDPPPAEHGAQHGAADHPPRATHHELGAAEHQLTAHDQQRTPDHEQPALEPPAGPRAPPPRRRRPRRRPPRRRRGRCRSTSSSTTP